MACKIRVLDEKTINQIAAGEVIENPASVVKELVDNAIDAGASKIVIEVQGSGRQSILVQDNGSGMGQDDALLCLERHSTSKIRSFDDLWQLSTMGFRGEALASIASVSDLSILTAVNDNNGILLDGTALFTSGGKILSCSPTKCLGGTCIEVKSLFHNVPARRKFQKSPTKDAADIIKIVMQMALSHPLISFELILNGQKELQLDPSSDPSFSDRIKQLLGAEFFSQLLPLHYANEQIALSGFIGRPTATKPTRSGQYLFVNNRPVQSHLLSAAVKEAYAASIDSARHPIFILHAQAAGDLVDVNVHPQKREVRFSLEDEIRKACQEAVAKVIFKVSAPPPPPSSSYAPPREFNLKYSYKAEHASPPPAPMEPQPLPGMQSHIQVEGTLWHYIFAKISGVDIGLGVQMDETLYVVDSKLALSRITFEKLVESKETESIQTLLVPIFIELSTDEAVLLKEKLTYLQQLGVNIYEFGVNSFLVDAIPSTLKNVDIEEWLRSMIQEQGFEQDPESGKKRVALLASRAQKIILPLSHEFSLQIIKTLLSCRDPLRCPLGFPTISVLTKSELMKKFQTKG